MLIWNFQDITLKYPINFLAIVITTSWNPLLWTHSPRENHLKSTLFFQNCKSTHRINSALVQEMVCSHQAPNHFCNYAEYLHLDFFYRELCSDSRLKIVLLKSQHWSQKWSDAAMSQAFFAGTKNMQDALGLQTNFS